MRTGRATIRLLEHEIRARYRCRARPVDQRSVAESYRGFTIWRGVVHVFELTGHPRAGRCYAWEEEWGVVTMLHEGPVDSPAGAVLGAARAAPGSVSRRG
jgi:hypothetical protein